MGVAIVPLGLAGIFVVVSYTTWITKQPFVCLLAPGFGFGILWMMGTDFLFSGTYSLSAFCASLVPFFLVNDLLLLNQFPDAEADASVGRRHLPITIGRKRSALVFSVLMGLCYLSIVVSVTMDVLPGGSLLGLLSLPLAGYACVGAIRHHSDMKELAPAIKANVLVNLATPVLMGVGILVSR